jgi:hypothetical protein
MASDESDNSADARNEQSALKRKLAWRMGFAGLMIVVLLGSLGLFDYLSAPSQPKSATLDPAQAEPESRKDVTQPVKIAEQSLEVGKEINVKAEPEVSAAPLDPSAPPTEQPSRPPRPQVSAQPVPLRAAPVAEAKPEIKPESKVSTRPQPRAEPKSIPLPPPASVPAQPPSAPASASASASTPAQPPRPPPASPRQTATPTKEEVSPEVTWPKPAPPRLFSGYALQAGVFADVRLAEELHAKLTLNGIPSTLEVHVKVGPFKTREETDAARQKMNALGLDTVLLMPKGLKR